MAFKKYEYKGMVKEVKELLRKRLDLKDRIRYHLKKIEHHQKQIDNLKENVIPQIEKQIDLMTR